MESKTCKVDVKRKGNRTLLILKGYCDEKNPNKQIKRVIDLPNFIEGF